MSIEKAGVAIIGCGYVGLGMRKIFPHSLPIDEPLGINAIEDAAAARLAIVCVPTQMLPDGSCDVSIVESVVDRLESDLILIKSTVEPGTCERLAVRTGKRICFSPEYMGESQYWTPAQFPNPSEPVGHGFMIIGGNPIDCGEIIDIFLPVLGPATRYRTMAATEAELVKYAENAFFALKVAYANDLRRICAAMGDGVSYHVVREGWLDDPRVGPMHSAAFKGAPGFAGKCLPKDIAALAATVRKRGYRSELLESVIRFNEELHGRAPVLDDERRPYRCKCGATILYGAKHLHCPADETGAPLFDRKCARCKKMDKSVTPPGVGVFYCSLDCAE